MNNDANFINSVDKNTKICPSCNTVMSADDEKCKVCGHDLIVAENLNNVEVRLNVQNEEQSVFAQGLPLWSIEPPQVMVRRRHL